jgi:dTDP-4-dehydrorhamnose 3,5-epimerase
MLIEPTSIPDVLLLTPKVHEDHRGHFLESFNQKHFPDKAFVQDNHSLSRCNTIRGLHYQVVKPQAKLVRVVRGIILDVAVDLRESSPTFKQHVAVELSADNFKQLYIPEGFAHGFQVLSEYAEVLYKTSEYWYKEHDRSINYLDPELNISWEKPWAFNDYRISDKDQNAPFLKDVF